MLKRIYSCEPVPMTLLYVLMTLAMVLLGLYSSDTCEHQGAWPAWIYWFSRSTAWRWGLSLTLPLAIAFIFKASVQQAAALDFKERISLYPLTLFVAPVFVSCEAIPALIVLLALVILFWRIIRLNEESSPVRASFEGGLIVGILATVSPLYTLLICFIWIGVGVMNTMSWRALFWSCIGLVTPHYLIVAISYIVSGEVNGILEVFRISEGAIKPFTNPSWWELLYMLIIVVISVLMTLRSLKTLTKGIAKRRKLIRLGLSLLPIVILISALQYQIQGVQIYISLLSPPLAILCLELFKTDTTRLDVVLFLGWFVLTTSLLILR